MDLHFPHPGGVDRDIYLLQLGVWHYFRRLLPLSTERLLRLPVNLPSLLLQAL